MSDETENGITRGTTNVFADLGLPDAVERQTKSRLAMKLNELLEERRLKQVETGRMLAIPQSKVSALVNYRLDGFSVEKLMEFLTRLNQDVKIVIGPSREGRSPGHVSVHSKGEEKAAAIRTARTNQKTVRKPPTKQRA